MKRPQTVADLGEDRVVAALTRPLVAGPEVVVGPGDDCAVLQCADSRHFQLFKTDAVVEGVHFLPGAMPAAVGWKAACRAVSDVAAMGGWPTHATIALFVSPGRSLAWVRDLYAGLRRAAKCHRFSIVGGETCRMPRGGPAVVAVSLLGRVERDHCLLRSGARPGDALFVSGQLGGSLRGWHLRFQPRLDQARWLAQKFRPSSMMDLSDGLARDLPRLASASGVGFEVDVATLPRRRGCNTEQALGDGEDYELLFTVPERRAASLTQAWKEKFPHLRLTRIGSMIPKDAPSTTFDRRLGWDQFSE